MAEKDPPASPAELFLIGSDLTSDHALFIGAVAALGCFANWVANDEKPKIYFEQPEDFNTFTIQDDAVFNLGEGRLIKIQIISNSVRSGLYVCLRIPGDAGDEAWIMQE